MKNSGSNLFRTGGFLPVLVLLPALLLACQKASPQDRPDMKPPDPREKTSRAHRGTAEITGPVEAFTILGDGVILNADGTWKPSGRRGVFEVDRNSIKSWKDVPLSKLLPAVVVDVYDGDTLTVKIEDPPPGIRTSEKIRLLGIDTPELDAAGSTPKGKSAFAFPARDFTSALALSKTVYLAFESAWRDGFSRLLCYAYLDDGSLLNTRVLSAGYAAVFTDIRCFFQEEFLRLEADARAAGLGFWNDGPSDGIVISTVGNESTREFVELINRSDRTVDLSGWKITDADGAVLPIPDTIILPPGGVFRVYSGSVGSGEPETSIHPTTRQIWNNGGDTAKLFSKTGDLVDEYSY